MRLNRLRPNGSIARALALQVLLPSVFLAFFNSANAQTPTNKIQFDFAHTSPNCTVPDQPSTFCSNDDLQAHQLRSEVIAKIEKTLDDHALNKLAPAQAQGRVPRVFVAFLSFSEKRLQAKLCSIAKAGIEVDVVLDHGSKGQIDEILNESCQKDSSKPNLKISYLGGLTKSAWRLHHNKFLVVDPGDGSEWSVNFSSGNLSTLGVTLHFDHWVFMIAPASSNLVRAHVCVIKAVAASAEEAKRLGMYQDGVRPEFDKVVTKIYLDQRESCYAEAQVFPMTDVEQALKAEGVATIFSPNRKDEAFLALKSLILSVKDDAQRAGVKPTISIAIQHFMHEPASQLLRDAAESGVEVRIIMDDDVITGDTQIPGAIRFLRTKLLNSKIQMRFIQSNANIRQMMHNKFAIFNGKKTFSGAGHYTTSAFKKNWENFYVIENEELAQTYQNYFEELWNLAVDAKSIRTRRP